MAMLKSNPKNIFALSTAPGKAGMSVIRAFWYKCGKYSLNI